MLGECRLAACPLKILVILVAMIGKGEYADPSARHEKAADLYITGIHKPAQILHYDIDAILMEISMIAE